MTAVVTLPRAATGAGRKTLTAQTPATKALRGKSTPRAFGVGPGGPARPVLPQKQPNRPGRARRRVSQILARVMLALMFVVPMAGAGALSAPPQAKAFDLVPSMCDFMPNFWNWDPEKPGAGVESFIAPDKDASYDGTGTMLDRYGVRGMQYSGTVWQAQEGLNKSAAANQLPERDCSILNMTMNMAAGMIFDGSRFVMSNTIGIQQRATDSTPMLNVMHNLGAGGMYDGLRNMLFWPAMSIMLMLTGMWVLAKNRDGKQRELMQGVGWSIGIALISGWLITPTRQAAPSVTPGKDPNFMWVTSSVNKMSDDLTGELASVLVPKQVAQECKVASGTKNEGRRIANCLLWDATLYRPWTVALWGPELASYSSYPFGVVKQGEDKSHHQDFYQGKDVRQMTLDSLAYSYGQYYKAPAREGVTPAVRAPLNKKGAIGTSDPNKGVVADGSGGCDWRNLTWDGGAASDATTLPPEGNRENPERQLDGCTKHGEWNLVRAKMTIGPEATYLPAFTGQRPVDRISQAMTSLVASLLLAVLYVFTSVLSMLWHAVPIVLLLALPFVGLVAIFPPARQKMIDFLQLWVKAFTLAFVMGIVQMLAAVVVAGIMVTGLPGGSNALANGAGETQSMSIGWKCLLLVVLVAGMLHVVKKAREDSFTPNLGGSVQAGEPLDRGLSKVGVVGAAGVGAVRERRRERRMASRMRGEQPNGSRRQMGRTLGAANRNAGRVAGGAAGLVGAVGARRGERKIVRAGDAPDSRRKSLPGRVASSTRTAVTATTRGARQGAEGVRGGAVGGAYRAGAESGRTDRVNKREDSRLARARREAANTQGRSDAAASRAGKLSRANAAVESPGERRGALRRRGPSADADRVNARNNVSERIREANRAQAKREMDRGSARVTDRAPNRGVPRPPRPPEGRQQRPPEGRQQRPSGGSSPAPSTSRAGGEGRGQQPRPSAPRPSGNSPRVQQPQAKPTSSGRPAQGKPSATPPPQRPQPRSSSGQNRARGRGRN